VYQRGSEYRYLGQQEINGKNAYVVAFAQQPEKAEPIGRFDVNGMSAPVLLQGVAWVEPNSFQILRMRTDLLKPLPRVRLVRQSTEIHFAPVGFKEVHTEVWLPQEVTVTVQWKGRTFRNSHRYSDFKLFNVGVQEKRKQALINQETEGKPN
jgi:hypothetical protein